MTSMLNPWHLLIPAPYWSGVERRRRMDITMITGKEPPICKHNEVEFYCEICTPCCDGNGYIQETIAPDELSLCSGCPLCAFKKAEVTNPPPDRRGNGKED
jgi:hypothetical protein